MLSASTAMTVNAAELSETAKANAAKADLNGDQKITMEDTLILMGDVSGKQVSDDVDEIIEEYGDINGDGNITVADAVQLIVYIKSKNVPGDINEDGLVNDKDASYLLKYVADSANEDFDDQLMKSRCTDAADASLILAYTAALADDPSISLSYFLSTVR